MDIAGYSAQEWHHGDKGDQGESVFLHLRIRIAQLQYGKSGYRGSGQSHRLPIMRVESHGDSTTKLGIHPAKTHLQAGYMYGGGLEGVDNRGGCR